MVMFHQLVERESLVAQGLRHMRIGLNRCLKPSVCLLSSSTSVLCAPFYGGPQQHAHRNNDTMARPGDTFCCHCNLFSKEVRRWQGRRDSPEHALHIPGTGVNTIAEEKPFRYYAMMSVQGKTDNPVTHDVLRFDGVNGREWLPFHHGTHAVLCPVIRA